jgi:hypothetical protein
MGEARRQALPNAVQGDAPLRRRHQILGSRPLPGKAPASPFPGMRPALAKSPPAPPLLLGVVLVSGRPQRWSRGVRGRDAKAPACEVRLRPVKQGSGL